MSTAQQIDPLGDGDFPAGANAADAPAAVQRVLDAMERAAIPFTLKQLPAELTEPEDLAEACDCDPNFIVQSLLLRGKTTKRPFLLLHSAASKVSDKLLGTIVGENLQRADAEYALRLTGFPIQNVPPMPHLNRIPVMLDGSLMRFARVFCPVGAPGYLASVPTLVLARAVSARIIRLET